MISETLISMQKRLNWTNARKILAAAGYSPGQGWAKTITKLGEIDDDPNLGRLQDQLIEHNLCGDKFTKLYPIVSSEREGLQRTIRALDISDCAATAAYPNAMSDDDLETGSGVPSIVSIESNEDGFGVVLSSIVALKKREEIAFEDFDDPAGMRQRFDEVVGMKFMKVQLFHVIWVPHHRDYLEIRVDYPRGFTDVLAHGTHSTLKAFVNEWGVVKLDKPVNLFPAVRRFYDDDKDGEISEITFATTTAAIKNEKMMRRSKQTDQRKEKYHLAGKEGLGTEIFVYRITVEWPIYEDNLSFRPNLTLAASGPSGKGQGKEPLISGALVGECIRATDYEFVIDRLGKKSNLEA